MSKDSLSIDELAGELEAFAPVDKSRDYSPEERRLVLGFEEIARFVHDCGRLPANRDGVEIFERLLAVRLKRLGELDEARELLAPLDEEGLLDGTFRPANDSIGGEAGGLADDPADGSANAQADDTTGRDQIDASDPGDLNLGDLSVDALADELSELDPGELGELRHVRPSEERATPDEVAQRRRAADFEQFAPIFEQVRLDLKNGVRQTVSCDFNKSVEVGDLFILRGQIVYIARKGEEFSIASGELDARLRVVFDNGTDSNLLMRSLKRALNDDKTSRRITKPDIGPLFSSEPSESDVVSGTIYVLRSLSDAPYIAQNRTLIHKIGVTTQPVATRLSDAPNHATYLLADVEVVAEYQLVRISPTHFEKLLHRALAPAQLNITIKDRFGKPVHPREWFLVPLNAVEEVIQRILDGSITDYVYHPDTARLELADQ